MLQKSRTVQIFELFEIIGGSDWAGHDKFRADLERSLPILRSCYFIADSVDPVHTASSTKHEELRKLGAVPFDYSNKNWITVMQELGGDAVFNPLGFESFDESYSVLRKGGILVAYGMNLPALTKTPHRPVFPAIVKLLSKNLLFNSMTISPQMAGKHVRRMVNET